MKNTKTRSYHRYCSLIATSLAFILGGSSLNANDISNSGTINNDLFDQDGNKYGIYFNNTASKNISVSNDLSFTQAITSGRYNYGLFLEQGNLTLQSSNGKHSIIFTNDTGFFGNPNAYGLYNAGATLNLQSLALIYGTTEDPTSTTFDTGLYVYNPSNYNAPIRFYFGNRSITNFGSIGGDSFKFAEGFSFKAKTLFEGNGASINVDQVQANKATGILIRVEKLDMRLSNSQLVFNSVLSSYESGGLIIEGAEEEIKRSKINLSNNAQILFKNITSTTDIAYGFYALGMTPIILADETSKIVFENIESKDTSSNEFNRVSVGGATGIVAQNSATYFFGDKGQDKGGGTIEFRKIKGVKFAQGMSDTSSDGNLNLNTYKTNLIFGSIEAEKASGIKSYNRSKLNIEQSSLTFKKIQALSGNAIGLQKTSINVKASSLSFGLISSNTAIAFGMNDTVLHLDNNSPVIFDSISSGKKAIGMMDSFVFGGNLTFNNIIGTEEALGIDLSSDIKVSNGAQIIFNNIGPSKVTSGIYYTASNKKELISESGWGSIVFKNIQPSSEGNADKHIDVLKLSNIDASLKIKNVSIAHGNPSNFDGMLYGIYNDVNNSHFTFANTTATYEGVEGKDIAGNIIKSTTNYWNNLNQTIKVAQNTTGYGIYSLGGTLGGRVKANITLDAQEVQGKQASNTSMVGIYLKEGDLIQTKKEDATLAITLKNATNAIGLLIAKGEHVVNSSASANTISLSGENVYGIVLEDGAKANIKNLGTTITSFAGTSKTVGVLFKGKSALSGTLAFADWQKGNFIEVEKDGALNGSIKISAYSSTNGKLVSTTKDGLLTLEAQGRIVLGDNPNGQDIYGLYNNLSGKTYGLDNVTFNTRRDFNGSNDTNQVYGIYSKQSSTFQLTEGSTLTFNVQKYKTDSGESFEGTAFGGDTGQEAKLILGNNSSVIFNANGGKLAQVTSNESSHVHLNLAGNNPERFQKTASLELRSLEVSKFDLKDSTITLYASKDAIIASTGYTGGKAYTGNDFFNNTTARGGSDRLIVKGSDLSRITNNTLELQVDHIDSSGTPIYAVLAQVEQSTKDKVIFNNLLNGESTDITVNTGFETAQYTLNRKDTSSDAYYYVNLGEAKNIQIDSDQISSATTAMLSNYTLYLANFNSLNKRLGELRDNTNEHGVWSRVFTGSMSNDFGIGGTQTYLTVQAGYDYGVTLENARNYIGVALAYVSSKNQSKETTIALGRNASLTGKTTGTSQGGELAIYNSYIADSGLYSDSILKLAYLNSEFDLFNQAKASNIANISAVLSQEVGYIFTFDQVKGLYITPSGEFSFGYLSQSDFTQTLQKNNQTYTLTSSQDAVTIFKSKVEATLGYFFEFGEQEANHATKGMSLYVGTGYEHDLLLSGGNINYKSDNSQANQYDALKSDGRVLLNVGTNIVFNDMVRVYADFETTFAGKINKDYQVNLGVRIGFGDNPTKEEKPTKEETKAPLSIKSE